VRKTTAVLWMFTLTTACAAGDDDRGAADSTSAATVGDTGGDSTTGGTTMPTSTTATATTLTGGMTSTGPETTEGGDTTNGGDTTTGASELSCDSYCTTYLGGCVDFNEYANEQDCLDNCAQWPVGEASDTANDSLGCRLYHATVASGTDPDVHCPHAGPSGAGMCIEADAPTCDVYCTRYFANCENDLNAFADMDECLDTCNGWYPGTDADVEGHTVGCHSYHANAAAGDPETHCPHAGPGGGGICVL
jgi:hypothetical protein